MRKLVLVFTLVLPFFLVGCVSNSSIKGATTSATVDRLEEKPSKMKKETTTIRIIPRGNQ